MSARSGMLAFVLLALSVGPILAQTTPAVVCIAGECIQGYSNITIGAQLSAQGAPTSIQLLPGQYTTDTNPQLLHDILVSSSARLSPSPGFANDTSMPLDFTLQPGLAAYSDALYSGQASFIPLSPDPSTNQSTPLAASSLAMSSNSWAALSISNTRLVIWDSIPDISQLPSPGSLSLLEIQSQTCTPQCSSAGICTPSGSCTCLPGFEGPSCESCSSGHFGPTCQPCPENCDTCDEGITGTGVCLQPAITNAPENCNCLNGVCGNNGQCRCNEGFTTGDDGKSCSKCEQGFFLTSEGNCQVCQLGCDQCTDGTGVCTVCKSGFSQDNNDRTKCNAPRSVTSTGTVCPNGAFANGNSCAACDAACSTCTAGTSTDCVVCAQGRFALDGACAGVNADGVCEGSSRIANNVKRACDTCPAKCTACRIPGFSVASVPTDTQCTACLPGSFLSNGQCVDACPSGTFLSQDGFTCTPCDSSCTSCSRTPTFCLTCPSNQLASNGSCISAPCPSNTFSANGACLPCHPDCTSCSGASFNQCTACPSTRPVLSSSGSSANGGRCLATCTKTQFFDAISGTCQACHSSCASCAGAGSGQCLSCQASDASPMVLRGGQCASTSCGTGMPGQGSGGPFVQGLGVCLSELVVIPEGDGTGELPPLPSVTGIDEPTKAGGGVKLEWWQILLMVLGCVAILAFVVWLLWCRRRNRNKRRQRKLMVMSGAGGTKKSWWRAFAGLFKHRHRSAANKDKDKGGSKNGKHTSSDGDDEPKEFDMGRPPRSSDEESDMSRLRRLRAVEGGLPTHYDYDRDIDYGREYEHRPYSSPRFGRRHLDLEHDRASDYHAQPPVLATYNITNHYSTHSQSDDDASGSGKSRSAKSRSTRTRERERELAHGDALHEEEEEEEDVGQLIDSYARASVHERSPTLSKRHPHRHRHHDQSPDHERRAYDARSQYAYESYDQDRDDRRRERERDRYRDDDYDIEEDRYSDNFTPLPPPPRPSASSSKSSQRYPRYDQEYLQQDPYRRHTHDRHRPAAAAPYSRHQARSHSRFQGENMSTISAPSIYSQMTGAPRRVPEPRTRLRGDESRWAWEARVDERAEYDEHEYGREREQEQQYPEIVGGGQEEVMSTKTGSFGGLKSRFSMSTLGTAARVKQEGKLRKKRGLFWRR